MSAAIDQFVDAMLDDAVRHWTRERGRAGDADPAVGRNECLPASRARHLACRDLAAAEARPRGQRPALIVINNLRGRCAEQILVERLCLRGFDVRNQLRIGPRRGGSVLDLTPMPAAPKRLPAGLESKLLHATDYRDANGRLRLSHLARQVVRDMDQVRRHMRQSRTSAVPGLPQRVRLFYQVSGRVTDAELHHIAHTIYDAVAAEKRRAPGQPQIAATVVRRMR